MTELDLAASSIAHLTKTPVSYARTPVHDKLRDAMFFSTADYALGRSRRAVLPSTRDQASGRNQACRTVSNGCLVLETTAIFESKAQERKKGKGDAKEGAFDRRGARVETTASQQGETLVRPHRFSRWAPTTRFTTAVLDKYASEYLAKMHHKSNTVRPPRKRLSSVAGKERLNRLAACVTNMFSRC